MECNRCGIEKLSSEFPFAISPSCNHAPVTCLPCLRDYFDSVASRCPECRLALHPKDVLNVKQALLTIECPVFQDLKDLKKCEVEAAACLPETGSVEIALIDGQRCTLQLSKTTSIHDVMRMIERRLQIAKSQQRLMHRGRELPVETKDGQEARWEDAGVPFGSVLQLVVIMYETGGGLGWTGSNVRNLTFDLSWTGMPHMLRGGKTTIKHLNGSCIILSRSFQHIASVDFKQRVYNAVLHHGPSAPGSARQKITVNLSNLSSVCAYLFFTLSAYAIGGITLSSFVNPSVQLLDADSGRSIAEYTASRASDGEAVVLCCAKKQELTGQWRVQRLGRVSDGNCRDYPPLLETLRELEPRLF